MKKFEHVVVVGIDGVGGFIKDADTPNFDKIFENGAVTYTALSCFPTASAECWGSMLLGVDPAVHKFNNMMIKESVYPSDSPFPSVFKRIKKAMPDAELGSFCNWWPITSGMIERDLNVANDSGNDAPLTEKICNYIREKAPTFLFIQFDSGDYVGHDTGYGSEAHLKQIHELDGFLKSIYDATREPNMENTLFMAISDHGGTPWDGKTGKPWDGKTATHGGWSDNEKFVTFAAVGKGVRKTRLAHMNIRDLSAIILYAFGIDAPDFDAEGWTSQIPLGLFEDDSITEYRDISDLNGAPPRISRAPHTSELV